METVRTFVKRNWLLLVLILVALVAAGYQGARRLAAENQDKTLSLVLDASQVNDLAAREGITVAETLQQVSPYVNALLFKESSLADLTSQGLASQMRGAELARRIQMGELTGDMSGIAASDSVIICADADTYQRVKTQIEAKIGRALTSPELSYESGAAAYVLATDYPSADLGSIGVGFQQQELQQAADAGMGIVVQIRAFGKVTEQGIDAVLAYFDGLPLVAVGFNDAEVPGVSQTSKEWAQACALWAEKIEARGVPVMTIEFYNQKGLSALAAKVDSNVLRMHTIQETERAGMTADRVIQRFQLAGTERNMRLILVRLGANLGLAGNMEYLSGTQAAMEDKGMTLGTPQPLPPLHNSTLVLLLIALGVAAGGILLCQVLGMKKLSWVLGILGWLGTAGLLFLGRQGLAVSLLSFLAVVIFPTLSVSWLVKDAPAKHVGVAIGRLLLMSLVSLVGALLMVGAMASRNYMLALDTFTGVKVAHLLPILLLAYIFWFHHSNQGKFKSVLEQTWRTNINVGFAFVVLLVLVAMAVYLLFVLVTIVWKSLLCTERTIPGLFDQVLVVRPRTKEFLFGHPLMLALLYFGYRKYIGLPVLAMACIGQVSLVNTFAHAHTPLWVSLLRTVNGLALGLSPVSC